MNALPASEKAAKRSRVAELEAVTDRVLAWSKELGFKGYNKHDGLNSPLMRVLLGWGKWPRLVAIQGVMRAPVNVRPLLFVPHAYNPKGLALFVQGLLDRYQTTQDGRYLEEARALLGLLLRLRSPGDWSGACWASSRERGRPTPW